MADGSGILKTILRTMLVVGGVLPLYSVIAYFAIIPAEPHIGFGIAYTVLLIAGPFIGIYTERALGTRSPRLVAKWILITFLMWMVVKAYFNYIDISQQQEVG